MIITPQNTLPHQYKFAYTSPIDFKHPAIVGGFGSGKTEAIPLRWLRLIQWRLKEQKRKCIMMFVEPTVEMVRDILVPTFNEYFDRHNIEHKYLEHKRIYSISWNGVWYNALLRSADKPSSLVGKNLTDVIIDEFDLVPYRKQKQIWNNCITRTRKSEHGTCGVTTTPEGFKLTYELWDKPKKNFRLIRAKTSDNIFLPNDFIENLKDQFDEKLILQYMNGEFVNIDADLAYYSFDRTKNVIPPYTNYDNVREVILSFDFNINPMSAVEIITDIDSGIRTQVMEYRVPNSKTADVCEQAISNIKEKYNSNISVIVTGDSSGDDGDTRNNISDYQIIAKCFDEAGFSNDMGLSGLKYYMSIPKGKKPVRERINMVNNLLDKGLYLICSNCVHSIKDREMVVWKKGAEQFKIDKTDSDRTHLSDAGDYGLQKSNDLIPVKSDRSNIPQDRRRQYG